ncbi:MAG: 50S ribosomal protein L18 [Planctomycetota bacterium]|jgi:large subunit ribosomal protein L18|nr:50S ribosomal protein L18 [Planctomycetota bacterium]
MDNQIIKRRSLDRKRRRIRKNLSGTAERPRLSVYRSECHIYGQLIDDIAGLTLVSVSTQAKNGRDAVKDLGPTDAAQKIGELLAEAAVAKGISQAVFDRGGRRYAGRVAALAEGARSKGLQF